MPPRRKIFTFQNISTSGIYQNGRNDIGTPGIGGHSYILGMSNELSEKTVPKIDHSMSFSSENLQKNHELYFFYRHLLVALWLYLFSSVFSWPTPPSLFPIVPVDSSAARIPEN